MISLTKIDDEHNVNCPHCGATRLVVQANSRETPGGGYWLSGGDTIFGLYRELINAGLEEPNDTDEPVNYDYALLVGGCSTCYEEYFVLEVSMIDDAVIVDREFVKSYFRWNTPVPPPTNFAAGLDDHGLEWLVHRYDTPRGISLTHTFGPFATDGGGIEYSWARSFIFKLWPQLKALARNVNRSAS